jgi:hypothetical protein
MFRLVIILNVTRSSTLIFSVLCQVLRDFLPSAYICCVQIVSRSLRDSVRYTNNNISYPLCQVSNGVRNHAIPFYVSIEQHVFCSVGPNFYFLEFIHKEKLPSTKYCLFDVCVSVWLHIKITEWLN